MALLPGERVETLSVRFRSLGCYPLTGAVESDAATLAEIIAEMRGARVSERSTRAIDHDGSGSMEQKKMEGYF
jgi:sulfate adenylyltransferase subunit 2